MVRFLGITYPTWAGGTDHWERCCRRGSGLMFCQPSRLEFPGTLNKGYLATDVGVQDSFKGKDLLEKRMEFEVDGFDGYVVICRDTGSRLRG